MDQRNEDRGDDLHTSESTGVATVVEHTLRRGRFSLVANEHLAYGYAERMIYCIDMGNNPNIPRLLDRCLSIMMQSTVFKQRVAAWASTAGRICRSLVPASCYNTSTAKPVEAHGLG